VIRAVLDANIYISALIRPVAPPGRILGKLLRDAAFEVVLSPAIIGEVQRALAYPRIRKLLRIDLDPMLWFEDIVVVADLVADTQIEPGLCADPDDDKYIAAAVAGRAAYLVTGDSQLLSIKRHEAINMIAPRAFLTILTG
jgi:uncharacterized protein